MGATSYDLIIRGGTVVNQDGAGVRDLAVRDGRIAAIGSLGDAGAAEMLDASGLHVLPGIVDSHVHFREPGAEHKEDLESGSRAAVMGGVTAIFEMPNTKPETTDAGALAEKLRRARDRMHCDHAFWVGATHDNIPDIAELEALPGAAGIKVFMGSSTGDLLVEDDASVSAILRRARRRVAFHSEDEPRLRERAGVRRSGDPASHAIWRDAEAAMLCTRRLIGLARGSGGLVHVLHVSTAEEMAYLAGHKDVASVEATPHHLTFSDADYARLGNLIQMNPPVRDAAHREALWRGVADGTVDTIGSDHAPHTSEDKAVPYPASPSGMPGVQTLAPLLLDGVTKGRLTLERFVDLTSAGPARLFGMAGKGRIAAGYDADLTLVDIKRRQVITNNWIASRCGWTPYDGIEVNGWPVATIVRGHIVMRDGELVTPGSGAPVRFHASLRTERNERLQLTRP